MESANLPSERDGLPIGGSSASTHFTNDNNSTNNTVQTDGIGFTRTSGRGEVSAAAGHQPNENLSGYAGENTHPASTEQLPPSRRVGGRCFNRHNQNNPETTEQVELDTRTRPNPNPRIDPNTSKKNTRANINIATLNVQGRGSTSLFDEKHKWHAINRMIQSEKIGILCTQETHLSPDQTTEINEFCSRNIKIFSTYDPIHPNSKGVAIALNKKITDVDNAKSTEIIQGRALLLETKWHGNEILTILAIYAPNKTTKNKDFWTTLTEKWTSPNSTLPFPDIMLGDFNITEDTIDCNNGEPDPIETTTALHNLKEALSLIDGWRQTFPHEKAYTPQHRSNGHRSRLDQIYMTPALLELADDWCIKYPPITSDHKMVSTRIAHTDAPHIGKGRWAIPNHVAKNRTFLKDIKEKGKELLSAAKEI